MSKGRVQKFSFDGNVIAYRKLGAGPAILVAFHGFGQSSGVFRPLERLLTSQFTIFAIDLFFHGHSEYNKNQLLTKPNWYRLMDAFLRAQGITRFSLMGFSLGGRFALTTVEAFAERIDQLFLMAPDGITQNCLVSLGYHDHVRAKTVLVCTSPLAFVASHRAYTR